MYYRHNLMFHRGAIEAAFVFDAHHGDPYAGHDEDGEVRQITADVAPFQARLDTVNHAYPNAERDALYEELWAAAEAKLTMRGNRVAGIALPPYLPPRNLLTVAQREQLSAQFAYREKLRAMTAAASTPPAPSE